MPTLGASWRAAGRRCGTRVASIERIDTSDTNSDANLRDLVFLLRPGPPARPLSQPLLLLGLLALSLLPQLSRLRLLPRAKGKFLN